MVATLTRPQIESLTDAAMSIVRARKLQGRQPAAGLDRYRYDPAAYVREKLGWEPWRGTPEQPGQMEVLDAYVLALRQQEERDRYEAGETSAADLQHWQPGQVIQNQIRIEAGHTVGKTKLGSGIVNHFFDCWVPSITYSFAPSETQVHDLLWKEIKADRRGKGLPGRILDLRLEKADDHFALGRATNNTNGRGTERIQGQHGKYLLFILDEAEGIEDYVWDAIKSMTSGGISVVLMLANPRTRTSRFHKARTLATVQSFRMSCLWHPNVLQGREVVPGAVRRGYVEEMVAEHCEVVPTPQPDEHTFTLPFDVRTADAAIPAGSILKPDTEMLFRVLGVAPGNLADNTLIPLGTYEAATGRPVPTDNATTARMGIDVARYGKDYGTLYVRHGGTVRRVAQLYHQDTDAYVQAVRAEALRLAALGVTSLRVRVDGGGGFGGGVIDPLVHDLEMERLFSDFAVLEVHFNGVPFAGAKYADRATEMYAEAAESLKGLAVSRAPALLEGDLTERTFKWMNHKGISVKKLEPKDDFKKRMGRSPDDGDGFVLAVAPDHIFIDGMAREMTGEAVEALAAWTGR